MRSHVAFFLMLLGVLALGACGGDSSSPGESSPASSDEPARAEQEPDEASQAEGAESQTEAGEGELEAPAGAEAEVEQCGDVTITESSGEGFFDVSAAGLSCDEATGALREWAASGYQGHSPPGLSCDGTDSTSVSPSPTLSCTTETGGTVEFSGGN